MVREAEMSKPRLSAESKELEIVDQREIKSVLEPSTAWPRPRHRAHHRRERNRQGTGRGAVHYLSPARLAHDRGQLRALPKLLESELFGSSAARHRRVRQEAGSSSWRTGHAFSGRGAT